jgi:uncharacterized protein YbjT (DUF2867 family)
MKIFLAGATGALGRRLLPLLVAKYFSPEVQARNF